MGEGQQEPRLTILKKPATLHQLEREKERERERKRKRERNGHKEREKKKKKKKSTKGGGVMRGKMDED